MIEIIIEISLYLIVAILLGFVFGWLISKASWQEKYEKKLENLKEIYTQEEKDKEVSLKGVHEREMEAFLFERTDIMKKYKELLLKIEEIKESQKTL